MRAFLCLPAIILVGCVGADPENEALPDASNLERAAPGDDVPHDLVAAVAAPCGPEDLECEPPVPDPGTVTCFGTSGPPPAGSATYRCAFDVSDAYGRPVAAQPVTMEVRWCSTSGTVVRKTVSGTTRSNGLRTLTAVSGPGNQIQCSLQTGEPRLDGGSKTIKQTQATAFPTNHIVPAIHVLQPAPSSTRYTTGLVDGEARLDLFQSGAYDKVLILPEPFDAEEHSTNRRDRKKLWKSLDELMVLLYDDGWDIWLFQPHDTGENLHEQAAELAKGIRMAATYAFCGGDVSVFGFNSGGVVGRLATARWEADPEWRAQLGLPAALPVSLLGTGDAPNYGMHLNLDMQAALWSAGAASVHESTNLDSCAAAQLLRGRWDPDLEVKTNADFLGFWVDGTATMGGACEAGPALATLNAESDRPGWPTTPVRVGFANSNATDTRKCFSGANEAWNHNAHGDDLCKYATDLFPQLEDDDWIPTEGQSLVKIKIDSASDRYWSAEDNVAWSDLTPGSRSPIFVDGGGTTYVDFQDWGLIFLTIDYHFRQRAPSTLIPYVSARGTQGPVGANSYATVSSPFSAMNWRSIDHSGVADVVDEVTGFWLRGRLNAYAPSCPGQVPL